MAVRARRSTDHVFNGDSRLMPEKCPPGKSQYALTVRFDMGAFCDPVVRCMYVDENGS